MLELTERQKMIVAGKVCPYCGNPTEFVDSSVVYGRSYGMIYLCAGCDAYVGVHKGTDKALGRVAKRPLRQMKHQAHEYFDKIWQLGFMSRREAYAWLSRVLDLPSDYTHIGMFSERTCARTINFSKQLLNDYRELDLSEMKEPKTPHFPL
ncbi:zinc-finger-containing protein [Bacteroides salyersiae]|uniref:zinc-finger-containing protein n=1 Tax=Bacteroides salyersiae TaxID=291644 RepID=UPI001CCD9785|nr:zinc-finger-containing protein [Bacteroides salyersiae]